MNPRTRSSKSQNWMTFPKNSRRPKWKTAIIHGSVTTAIGLAAACTPELMKNITARIDANAKTSAKISMKAQLKEKQFIEAQKKQEMKKITLIEQEALQKRMKAVSNWTKKEGIKSTPSIECMLSIILRTTETHNTARQNKKNINYEETIVSGVSTLQYYFGLMEGVSTKREKACIRIRDIWYNSAEGATPELKALLKKRVTNRTTPTPDAEIIEATANTPIELRRDFYKKVLLKKPSKEPYYYEPAPLVPQAQPQYAHNSGIRNQNQRGRIGTTNIAHKRGPRRT